MLIWYISLYEPLPIDGENVRKMRTGWICEALLKENIVELWIPGFDHLSHHHYKKESVCEKLESGLNIQYLKGIVLGLISAFLASLFSVLNGLMVKENSAITISFFEFISGVFFISIFLMFNNEFSSVIIDDLFSLNYLYIFLLGSVCTAYAFMASVYLLKFISPYSLVLTYNLEPIYGIILALIFFGDNEKMSLPFYIGFFLILFSVLTNMYIKKKVNK